MDVWDLIRKAALSDGLTPEERQTVLEACDDCGRRIEELRSQAEQNGAERDSLKQELAAIRRAETVKVIAEKHNFIDPGYLDYLLASRSVDVHDAEGVETVIGELKAEKPRFFKVDITPGPSTAVLSATVPENAGDLISMVRNAPELL